MDISNSNLEIETLNNEILRSEITQIMKMIEIKTNLHKRTIYEDPINSIYIFYNEDNTQRLSLSRNRESNTFTITLITLYKNLRQANIKFALTKSIMLKIITCLEMNQFELLDECLICHEENLDEIFICENCKSIANLI